MRDLEFRIFFNGMNLSRFRSAEAERIQREREELRRIKEREAEQNKAMVGCIQVSSLKKQIMVINYGHQCPSITNGHGNE